MNEYGDAFRSEDGTEYRWYVVHTYSGYEDKVMKTILKVVENRGADIQRQVANVCVPVKLEEDPKSKNKEPVKKKLFPGYVLVKVAVAYDDKEREYKMSDEVWYLIRNTRGVTGFVGPNGRPVPLTEEEAYRLGVEKRTIRLDYQVGDHVIVRGSSLDGMEAVVDAIDLEKKTVRVTIWFMGREMVMDDLSLDEVEPIA